MTFATRFHLAQTKSRRRKARQQFRLFCEPLEARTVPALFWVTNTNDEGVGSLRQAITDANTAPGADNIKFKSSADGTITLTTGELSITSDLQIDGPGAKKVTISGGGTSRVFNVASGVNVRIDDVTISKGSGGGILNAGNLTLNDSIVAGCSAAAGGGIVNTGNLTLNRSKLAGNSAGGGGGGLFNTGGGTALLDHATLSGNTSHFSGAIHNNTGSTLIVKNSLITGNNCDRVGAGAIASGGPLNIINSTISENIGGIPAISLGGGPSVEVVISGSRIVHNKLAPGNFLVYAAITSEVHLRIEDTTISENVGDLAGGIVLGIFGSTEIVNSTISGNVGTANNSYAAGGISTFGQQLTLVNSSIRDNIGVKAGGIYMGFGSSILEITNSTISGNTAIPITGGPYSFASSAGGIATYSATTINNSTISGNTVVADGMVANSYVSCAAGGILAYFPGVAIDHSTIASNKVTNAPLDLDQVSGGVVGINDFFTADVSIRNTIVAENTAANRDPDVTGSFQSAGHNLIGILTSGATGFVASDLTGDLSTPLDPRIGPLKNNGGPTFTHALRGNSPALNAGDNSDAPPNDQRGQTRIVGGTIDIGAFESQDDDNGQCGSSGGRSAPPARTASTNLSWLRTVESEKTIFNSMFEPGTVHSRLHEFDRDDAVFLGLYV